MWLANVVVGTLEAISSRKARHQGWTLDGALGDLYGVSGRQASVGLEARSGTLIFQSSNANGPEQRRVRSHGSESREGVLCVFKTRGARLGEVEYRWKLGTRRIAGSELEQWEGKWSALTTCKAFESIFPCPTKNCLHLNLPTTNSILEQRLENGSADRAVFCNVPKST